MPLARARFGLACFTVATAAALSGCGGDDSSATGGGGASSAGGSSGHGGGVHATGTGGSAQASTSGHGSGAGPSSGTQGSGGSGGFPSGWLYTSGNHILISDGHSGGAPWMGRGVNMDDIFFCGYDNTLWMTAPDHELETMVMHLMSEWKPNFVRMSLGMNSYPTVTNWTSNDAQYKTPMTGVINALGSNAGVYVLVTLRSHTSMIGQDPDADPEATGLPSDATSTPDAQTFPTGTDATYQAIVDTFAQSKFVLFGLTNEPGGNTLDDATIAAAMSHAVGVIRAEEDRLGAPHHIVSVQGNNWTSEIGFYATSPLPYDNVVYEVHGYPPTPSSYTYANIPVILGEYGSLDDSAAFFADVESKQIPNLAWDFDSYSNCAPDLLDVNQSSSNLVPSAWGSVVQSYLLMHSD